MRRPLHSLMLALLYLSVSLNISGHVHDNSHGLSHQCLACAWHFEGTADTPAVHQAACAPSILTERVATPEFRAESDSPLTCSDRGPPSFS